MRKVILAGPTGVLLAVAPGAARPLRGEKGQRVVRPFPPLLPPFSAGHPGLELGIAGFGDL